MEIFSITNCNYVSYLNRKYNVNSCFVKFNDSDVTSLFIECATVSLTESWDKEVTLLVEFGGHSITMYLSDFISWVICISID